MVYLHVHGARILDHVLASLDLHVIFEICVIVSRSPFPLIRQPVMYRGRILGHNWDNSLNSFPPCYSQSPLQTDFTPTLPRAKVV